MRLLAGALLAASVTSGVALAERIADPFDRYEPPYTLEGPPMHSETFYVSVNWYDSEGNKHDDRAGDAMIALTLASSLGALAAEMSQRDRFAATVVQQ